MTRRKRRNKGDKKNYIFLVILLSVFSLLLFININIWGQRAEIRAMMASLEERRKELEVEKAQTKDKEIKRDIEEEIERIAREQLLLKKEGESVVIISQKPEILEDNDKEDGEEETEEKGLFDGIMEIIGR